MAKLIVIDGNSLLFRAYYATAYGTKQLLSTSDGTPTNAVFAFSNMINKLLGTLKEGDGIIVAFDTGKHTFRHEALETYKANRKPAPTELVQQFPIAREFLNALDIYQFEEDGFEGDDIAGTIAKQAEKEGFSVNIYTSDRDFLQLISNKISINLIKKGLTDVQVMTPDLMVETYGFTPKQIIDYKGLRGDSADNLPGIPGIGEVTAVKLIQQYGDFDNIIAHAEEIGGKVGQSLIENKELGTLCRDLAIIDTNVTLPFSVEDTIYHGYDFNKINEFCHKYELKQFMTKLHTNLKRESLDDTEINVEEIRSFEKYKDVKEIGIALDYVEDDYSRSDIFGLAINANGKHIYMYKEDLLKDKYIKDVLKDESVKKYCYDYKAIKVCLNNAGIELNGAFFDLLLATYLLDSSLNTTLDSVMSFFGVNLPQADTSLLSDSNSQRCAKTAFYAQMLYPKVKKELEQVKALDLFNNIEVPLSDSLARMEIEGFPIDVNVLEDFGKEYREKLSLLEEEIYSLAGEKFNIASPKQVGEILYNKLGIPDYKKGSTSVDALKELKKYHPIVDKILEYRKYFKLLTTYVDGLKVHVFDDGKIHAKFNQALTATGRLSSSDPNLQNISIRDEEGKLIRKAFYYPDENYEILSLDYSQIELRILASISNCEGLKEIFASGEDIHASTAKRVFHLDGEPSELQRRKAKAVNFGIIYGISDFGLSEQLGISFKEAKDIINEFYNAFPEVLDLFQKIVADANENGYVETIFGRRRYLSELRESNYQKREFAKRAAMNAPIQGSAADLIKVAMLKVDKKLKEEHLESKIVLQIHDELILKVPLKEKEKVYKLVKEEMEHAVELNVGLEVDGGFGRSWYDAK